MLLAGSPSSHLPPFLLARLEIMSASKCVKLQAQLYSDNGKLQWQCSKMEEWSSFCAVNNTIENLNSSFSVRLQQLQSFNDFTGTFPGHSGKHTVKVTTAHSDSPEEGQDYYRLSSFQDWNPSITLVLPPPPPSSPVAPSVADSWGGL